MQRELILNFHGIGTPHPAVGPDERRVWMSREKFAALLDHVAAVQAAQPMPIAITFDDGNASDADIALEELSRRNLKAAFFVCAGRLDTPQYLSRAAVRDLLDAGMQVGSHGMHHRDWRTLDDATLDEEIGTARLQLEEACGRPVTTVAIPFGAYNRRVLTRVRAEGFACAYTSDRGYARRTAWLKPRNTLRLDSVEDDISRWLTRRAAVESALRDVYGLYRRLR
jgi:peptidoglycan/xylan/chitin deacetylase (PgdA/CDA1 family)